MIVDSSGWASGQMKWAKKALNHSIYDVTHKKSKTQNKKFFFIADLKTCQIFWVFEQISSTYDARDIQVQRHVQTVDFTLKTYQKPTC